MIVDRDTLHELMKRQVQSFVYALPPAPFSFWTSLFKSIRVLTRMDQLFPISTFNGISLSSLDLNSLLPLGTYYLPVGILIATMLVAAILMLISCCCMCCFQCCATKYLRSKYQRKTPPTKFKKGVAWCFFFLPVFVIGLSIAAHLGGVNHFTVGVQTIQGGIGGMLDQSKLLIDSTVPTLSTVIGNLKVGVNSAIDLAVDSVSLQSLETTVYPPLLSMCTDLETSQVSVDSIKSSSAVITTSVNSLKSLSSGLVISIPYLI
jgi:hypothetical protein